MKTVWNFILQEYPFIFGTTQHVYQKYMKSKSILNAATVENVLHECLYLRGVQIEKKVKKGVCTLDVCRLRKR